MATNYIQDGDVLSIAAANKSSGDVVVAGTITGVALGDTDSDGNVQTATRGVFNLEVHAYDGSANSAIGFGDKIYWDSGNSELNKNSSGLLFGKTLGAVSSGGTASINILLVQA